MEHDIHISMDGKGCWRDNVFVERLWRSVKYAEVYLHAYDSVSEAKTGLGRYFNFYNAKRPPVEPKAHWLLMVRLAIGVLKYRPLPDSH
jgi:hypothetical protein